MLTKYKPDKKAIASSISQMVQKYIYATEDVTREEAHKFDRLMGRKFRESLDVDEFIESCVERSYEKWKLENLEQLNLWKDIAIANASHSNTPEEVANATVKEFNKQFKVE